MGVTQVKLNTYARMTFSQDDGPNQMVSSTAIPILLACFLRFGHSYVQLHTCYY